MSQTKTIYSVLFFLGTAFLFFSGPVIGHILHNVILSQTIDSDIPASIVELSTLIHFAMLPLSFIFCLKALFVILIVYGLFSWFLSLIFGRRNDTKSSGSTEDFRRVNTLIFLPLILIPTLITFLCGAFVGVATRNLQTTIIVYSLVGALYGFGIFLLLHLWFNYGNPDEIPM